MIIKNYVYGKRSSFYGPNLRCVTLCVSDGDCEVIKSLIAKKNRSAPILTPIRFYAAE